MWLDLDIELRKGVDGDLLVMQEEDAIVNSLKNICSTMQGSRRMLPEFALPLFSMLFQPIDEETAYAIGNALLSAIENWDDRIELTGVHVNANPDDAQYEATMSYKIKNSLTSSVENTYTLILKQQA